MKPISKKLARAIKAEVAKLASQRPTPPQITDFLFHGVGCPFCDKLAGRTPARKHRIPKKKANGE